MKSTIKIALGENNEPIIRFNIVPSDDIRDQLCKQFLQKLGGSSTLCSVSIDGYNSIPELELCHVLDISPLTPRSYYLNYLQVTDIFNHLQKKHDYITMLTAGDYICFQNNKTDKLSKELRRDRLIELNIVKLVEVVSENFYSVITVPQEALLPA